MATETGRQRYQVEGMDCGSCATKIGTAVGRLPGISDVSVSATTGGMSLAYVDEAALETVEATVRKLGYGIAPKAEGAARASHHPAGSSSAAEDAGAAQHGGHDHHHEHDHSHDHAGCGAAHDHGSHGGPADQAHKAAPHTHDPAAGSEAVAGLHGHDHGPSDGPWWKTAKARLTLASGVALVAAYLVGLLVPAVASYAFALAMLVGLVPIARRALAAAMAGIPFTIETLMTIAAVGAVIIDAGEEAAAVVFLFLVGELLEGVAAGRARASITALSALVPKTALVETPDGGLVTVPAETLAVGAVLLVRPGDRIPPMASFWRARAPSTRHR